MNDIVLQQTVNGTPVPIKDGEMQGKIGEKISSSEEEKKSEDLHMRDYSTINNKIKDLIDQGIVNPHIGEAKEAVPVEIAAVNKHALKHGVTKEEAQGYINNAIVMFDQVSRSLFISDEGNAVMLDNERRLISAYRKEDFDPGIHAILKVVKSENGI